MLDSYSQKGGWQGLGLVILCELSGCVSRLLFCLKVRRQSKSLTYSSWHSSLHRFECSDTWWCCCCQFSKFKIMMPLSRFAEISPKGLLAQSDWDGHVTSIFLRKTKTPKIVLCIQVSYTVLDTNHGRGQSTRYGSVEFSPSLVLVNIVRNDIVNSEIQDRKKSFELRKLSQSFLSWSYQFVIRG